MYYLDLSLHETCYDLEEEDPNPDSYIDSLNVDLTLFDELLSENLPERAKGFIFDGLDHLIATFIASNLKSIKRLNLNGVTRLVKSVQSILQNLTNIIPLRDSPIVKIKTYCELAALDANVMDNNLGISELCKQRKVAV
jgi:exocyst complex component 4